MADVCLVSPPTLGRAKSTIVPHWRLWLSTYIDKQGHHVYLVDVKSQVNAEPSWKEEERIFHETVEKAVASGSPLIGLSEFTEDYGNWAGGLCSSGTSRSSVCILCI